MRSVLTKQGLETLYIDQKMSSVEIAAKLGTAVPTISNALRRLGIPRRSMSEAAQNRREQTYNQNWKELRSRYEEGENLEDLASEVGCSTSTAAVHLRAVGTKIRPRGSETVHHPNYRGRIDIDVKKASKMNKAGATLTEIGAKLGVSVQIVSKRLQESGIQVVVNKASKDEFKNIQAKKREIARAIGATKCVVCGETRGTQLCHIQSRRKGGPLNPYNAVALCPNHHDFFDHGRLKPKELAKLNETLLTAAEKGYVHHIYSGSKV